MKDIKQKTFAILLTLASLSVMHAQTLPLNYTCTTSRHPGWGCTTPPSNVSTTVFTYTRQSDLNSSNAITFSGNSMILASGGPTPSDTGSYDIRYGTSQPFPIHVALPACQIPTPQISMNQANTNTSPSPVTICVNNSIQFTNSGSFGGNLNSTAFKSKYTWSFPGGSPLSATISPGASTMALSGSTAVTQTTSTPISVTFTSSGVKVVTLTATNWSYPNSTSKSVTMTVNVIGGYSISPSVSGTIACGSPTVSLFANPSNTVSQMSYTWNGPQNSTSQNINVTQPGIYTLSAKAYTCPAVTKTIQVVANMFIPTISFSSAPLVNNCNAQIHASSNSTNFGMSIIGPNGYTSTASTNTVSTPGTYTVVVTDLSSSCSSSATTSFTLNPTPTISIAKSSICENQTVNVNSSPNGSIVWLPNSPSSSGNYTVTSTTPAGCQSSQSVAITVYPLPSVIASDKSICSGNSATLTATGNADTYAWSSGEVVSPVSTSTYTVTGTDTITDCTNVATATVTVHELPSVSAITSTTTLCKGNSATLTATGANTYAWEPNGSGQEIIVNPTSNTSYTVKGTDANGCTNAATVSIEVKDCSGDTTGIHEYEASKMLSIYPHPANGEINVKFPSEGTLSIFDMCGSVVYTSHFNKSATVSKTLATGFYIVQIRTLRTFASKKIAVMH